MSEATERCKSEILSLIPSMELLCQKHDRLSYVVGRGKNANGIYIHYDGHRIADVWAFERGSQMIFHSYAYCVSDEDKAKAVEVPKGARKENYELSRLGERVYNHQGNYTSYKIELDKSEIYDEIEKIYSVAIR